MVLSLDQVLEAYGHVVAQVIETELIVGSECDVAVVGLAPLGGVGVMLVDAVHGKAMELVQGAHPLGVTLGEVVIDGDHVDSLACEGVEEYGKGSYEGLSLTGRHLGDLSLVEDNAADELHVVVDHVPLYHVPAGKPGVVPQGLVTIYGHELVGGGKVTVEVGSRNLHYLILLETAGGGFHDGESLGKDFLEDILYLPVLFLHEFIGLGGELFLL